MPYCVAERTFRQYILTGLSSDIRGIIWSVILHAFTDNYATAIIRDFVFNKMIRYAIGRSVTFHKNVRILEYNYIVIDKGCGRVVCARISICQMLKNISSFSLFVQYSEFLTLKL